MYTMCKGLTLARNANYRKTSKNVLNNGYIFRINAENKYNYFDRNTGHWNA